MVIFFQNSPLSWEEGLHQVFHIYFDTSTFDEIERDVRSSFEDQLGVLRGTMGLFTGFSILSGVEIIFYLTKLVVSLGRKRSS